MMPVFKLCLFSPVFLCGLQWHIYYVILWPSAWPCEATGTSLKNGKMLIKLYPRNSHLVYKKKKNDYNTMLT